MFNRVHFSSQSFLWNTPYDVFVSLDNEFNFELDVCCSSSINSLCSSYISETDDALTCDWDATSVWCNPPYSRNLYCWIRKAFDESIDKKSVVVLLLPARTDTRWFHDYCIFGEIRFIRGRLKFSNSKNNAPFPSMIVIFDNRIK